MSLSGDQRSWDRRLAELASPPPLLQSWVWGEAQREVGWWVERIELADGMASAQCRKEGGLLWGYVPRGPVPATRSSLEELSLWARQRGLVRLRVEPDAGPELAGTLEALGFLPAISVQPTHTLIVRLGSDAEMLASFRSNHRYSLRVADRRGVKVEEGSNDGALADLVRLTAGRHGINLPPARYLKLLLDRLDGCRTFIASVDGTIAAGALMASFGGRAYYLYAGSSGDHRDAMPAYAALWAGIRAAARGGSQDLDLWGVAPEGEPNHPWAGLTLFKRGFGGLPVEYVGAWDLKLQPAPAALLDRLETVRRTVRSIRGRSRGV